MAKYDVIVNIDNIEADSETEAMDKALKLISEGCDKAVVISVMNIED